MSIIDDMTAEAQAARDAFAHNTVAMDGKTYAIREPWESVLDRAAAKFGGPAPDDEAMRFARAVAIGKGGK